MNSRILTLYQEITQLGIIPYYFTEPKDKWFRLIDKIIKTHSDRVRDKTKLITLIAKELSLDEKELETLLNKIISRIKSKVLRYSGCFEDYPSQGGLEIPISGSLLLFKRNAREFVILRPKDRITFKKNRLNIASTYPETNYSFDFLSSQKLIPLSRYEYLYLFYLEKI